MVKVIIGHKGKAWRFEVGNEIVLGRVVGDKITGKDIKPELDGYDFEITGGSDDAGFPLSKNVEGLGLRRVLLTKGFGMRERNRGLRKRKTVRGKVISDKISQINMKVVNEGNKKLEEIFADQNKVEVKEEKADKAK